MKDAFSRSFYLLFNYRYVFRKDTGLGVNYLVDLRELRRSEILFGRNDDARRRVVYHRYALSKALCRDKRFNVRFILHFFCYLRDARVGDGFAVLVGFGVLYNRFQHLERFITGARSADLR